MKAIRNWNQLEKALNEKINKVLKNEVAAYAKETMKEVIKDDVYGVYNPKMYERTYQLLDSIDVEEVDENKISIRNTRSEIGKDIAETIETGIGYDYLPPEYNPYDEEGNTYLKPRPFTQNTRELLQKSGVLNYEMKEGLKKLGLKVE